MNEDTGVIRQLKEGEKLKNNEIQVRKPNPLCPRCHGEGSYLTDVTNDPDTGNRATRRNLKKRGLHLKYFMPCPDCAEWRNK